MNHSSVTQCNIKAYFTFCALGRITLLGPGLSLNIFILVSVVTCLLSKKRKIKKTISVFVIGSTLCNIVNLSSWPVMIHWRIHRKWLLRSMFCEIMVHIRQITSTISFYYVSSISFSVYLVIVYGCSRIVDHKLFLAFELLFPVVPVCIKELWEYWLDSKQSHYDVLNHTCFSIVNDQSMKIQMLSKVALFLPLTLYFYAHTLHTLFKSAHELHRSQRENRKLAKIFSAISLITLLAHTPGGVFSLITEEDVCFETATEFLFDLPLFTNPVILFFMNKELRAQCSHFLHRKSVAHSKSFELTSTIFRQNKPHQNHLGDKET